MIKRFVLSRNQIQMLIDGKPLRLNRRNITLSKENPIRDTLGSYLLHDELVKKYKIILEVDGTEANLRMELREGDKNGTTGKTI